jgi:hypothetical protein
MSRLKLQLQVIEALRSTGASEEIVALMQSCFEACLKPTGRPRQYPNRTEKQRAYRARRKQREKSLAASPERRAEAFVDGRIDTRTDEAPPDGSD